MKTSLVLGGSALSALLKDDESDLVSPRSGCQHSCKYSCEFVETFDSLGIDFLPYGESNIAVGKMAPNGEGAKFISERGGIMKGDIVVSINNVKVRGMSPTMQMEQIASLPRPITIKFRRPDESHRLGEKLLSWKSSWSSINSRGNISSPSKFCPGEASTSGNQDRGCAMPPPPPPVVTSSPVSSPLGVPSPPPSPPPAGGDGLPSKLSFSSCNSSYWPMPASPGRRRVSILKWLDEDSDNESVDEKSCRKATRSSPVRSGAVDPRSLPVVVPEHEKPALVPSALPRAVCVRHHRSPSSDLYSSKATAERSAVGGEDESYIGGCEPRRSAVLNHLKMLLPGSFRSSTSAVSLVNMNDSFHGSVDTDNESEFDESDSRLGAHYSPIGNNIRRNSSSHSRQQRLASSTRHAAATPGGIRSGGVNVRDLRLSPGPPTSVPPVMPSSSAYTTKTPAKRGSMTSLASQGSNASSASIIQAVKKLEEAVAVASLEASVPHINLATMQQNVHEHRTM